MHQTQQLCVFIPMLSNSEVELETKNVEVDAM